MNNFIKYLFSFVAKVSARAPSGVWYEIESGNKDLKFAINSHSGVLSLANLIDREKQSIYNMTITATAASGKKSRAYVIVLVTDVNDNRFVVSRNFLSKFVTVQGQNNATLLLLAYSFLVMGASLQTMEPQLFL